MEDRSGRADAIILKRSLEGMGNVFEQVGAVFGITWQVNDTVQAMEASGIKIAIGLRELHADLYEKYPE